MTAPESNQVWARAYARQARSDLAAREVLLTDGSLPRCHELHYLQMACEKLCKAYLCNGGAAAADLQSSHAYIAKTLPSIAQELLARSARQKVGRRWEVRAIAALARRIELLAPSVRGGGAVPANVEYPWSGPDGDICIPAHHNFGLDMLHERAGQTLLKLLFKAAADLADLSES